MLDKQPIAFNDSLWNFLGGSRRLGLLPTGGRPLRQVVLLSGTGNADLELQPFGSSSRCSFATILALAFINGTYPNGKIAVVFGIIVTVIIGLMNIRKAKEA